MTAVDRDELLRELHGMLWSDGITRPERIVEALRLIESILLHDDDVRGRLEVVDGGSGGEETGDGESNG